MFAKISWLGLLVAVGLFIWSALLMLASRESQQIEEGLIVLDTKKDLGERTCGSHTFELRVRNNADKPLRVMGMPDT